MPATAQEIRTPSQQEFDSAVFPVVFSGHSIPDMSTMLEWLGGERLALEQRLSDGGAILMRGFPLSGPEDFDSVIRRFGWPNFRYAESLSNAVRRNVTERVFTANEAPPDVAIYLHHEMAQTPVFPERLLFYCEIAPETGGATPLCRSDILLERLSREAPDFVARCRAEGLRYTNTMPAADNAASGQGRSWQSTLAAADRDAAQARLRELGYDWEWQRDGSLRTTTPTLPAIVDRPDGRPVFFNQLIAAWRGWSDAERSVTFGDGSRIEREAMETVLQLSDELSVDLAWEANDVAIVDNYRVMHGRRPFTGRRRVLASLAGQATHTTPRS